MSERHVILPARQARIEFLRTRAAYEREALSFHTSKLGRELSPRRWLGGLLNSNQGDADGRSSISNLFGQVFSLAIHYPYVTAAVSSLLVGKRWRWLKLAGIGIGVWRTFASGSAQRRQ